MAEQGIVLTDFDKFLKNLFTVCVQPTITIGAGYTLISGLPGFYTYLTFLAYQHNNTSVVTLEEENGRDLVVFQAGANVFNQLNFGLLPMRAGEKGTSLILRHAFAGSVDAKITAIGFYDDTQF